MEDGKFGLSMVLGIILTAVICVNTNITKLDIGYSAGFILVIVMYFGLSILIYFLLNSLSTGVRNTKEKVNKIVEEQKLNNDIKNNLKQQEIDYKETKSSHQYFSDEKLLDIFQRGVYQNSQFKQLALEEILVERSLISHSETHEKMHNMQEYFLNNKS